MAKLSVIEARKAEAVERLEAKLNLIMAKLGISFDTPAEQTPVEPAAEQQPAEQTPVEPAAEPKTRKGK